MSIHQLAIHGNLILDQLLKIALLPPDVPNMTLMCLTQKEKESKKWDTYLSLSSSCSELSCCVRIWYALDMDTWAG